MYKISRLYFVNKNKFHWIFHVGKIGLSIQKELGDQPSSFTIKGVGENQSLRLIKFLTYNDNDYQYHCQLFLLYLIYFFI
jgi:hypothetical protein